MMCRVGKGAWHRGRIEVTRFAPLPTMREIDNVEVQMVGKGAQRCDTIP